MTGEPARFFLDTDHSAHWYLVKEAHRAEWNAWLAIDEDDERAWDVPDFATRLNGSPSRVTFEEPRDA